MGWVSRVQSSWKLPVFMLDSLILKHCVAFINDTLDQTPWDKVSPWEVT